MTGARDSHPFPIQPAFRTGLSHATHVLKTYIVKRQSAVCRLMCTKIKTHHTHVSSTKSVTSHMRKPISRVVTRTSLPSHIPRFPLGEVLRLGLDRSESRESLVLIFALFRDSFEAILSFFWWSEGPRNYPRSMIQSLPSVSGRRGDLPMPSANSKGHNHRFDIRHPEPDQ